MVIVMPISRKEWTRKSALILSRIVSLCLTILLIIILCAHAQRVMHLLFVCQKHSLHSYLKYEKGAYCLLFESVCCWRCLRRGCGSVAIPFSFLMTQCGPLVTCKISHNYHTLLSRIIIIVLFSPNGECGLNSHTTLAYNQPRASKQ